MNDSLACLHEGLYQIDHEDENKIALIWYEDKNRKEMSYKNLKANSLKAVSMLREYGVVEGDMVAVQLPKGTEQMIAVLGILAAGAAYIPINYDQPHERVIEILNISGSKYLISDDKKPVNLHEGVHIKVIPFSNYNTYSDHTLPVVSSGKEIAYVIFTSGSTGKPKGVAVTHESAMNTITDVNKRFNVTKHDRMIAVSELGFDLSVYDMFGTISCGGSLVLLNEDQKKEPYIWYQYINENHITLWNSVPALYEMLMIVMEQYKKEVPLKKVFLSGDWIGMNLYERTCRYTGDCRFIAMGGATEASIWSNYYEVKGIDDKWESIPYGAPLSNQKMRIVDEQGDDCPEFVPGELWIGGKGVALGYINQPELTEERFVTKDGQRWYRTGDRARYMEHHMVEFLGRMDYQVKVNGFRIELGEIEHALKKHPMIQDAVVVVADTSKKKLVASVVPGFDGKEAEISLRKEGKNEEGSIQKEERSAVVERFLTDLLCSDGMDKDWETFLGKYKLQHGMKCLIEWLQKREVIMIQNCMIKEGRRFGEVKSSKSGNTTLEIELIKSKSLILDVLTGKKSETEMLGRDILNPEYLLSYSDLIDSYITEMIDWLKKQYSGKKLKQKLGFLDVRSGQLVEGIIEQVKEMFDIVLFDQSGGMLNAAKERFDKYEELLDFQRSADTYVKGSEIEKFDYLISFNSLHQYKDAVAGLQIADMLLKPDGIFLCMEYVDLDPMALVSSAILEDGFKQYAGKRNREYNPFLTIQEWMEEFRKTNFEKVSMRCDGSETIVKIEARKRKEEDSISVESLKHYIMNKLPHYMCPEQYIYFRKFPLNSNGKTDRKKVIPKDNHEEGGACDYVTEAEERIGHLWKILINTNAIYRESDFFEVGGDSLIATRFINEARKEYGIELTLGELFQQPQLYQVAALFDMRVAEMENMVEGEI